MVNYHIGGLDAWEDDSIWINKCFVSTQHFMAITEFRRCFLAGRRGSGKSAIGIMSAKMGKWDICEVKEGEKAQYGAYTDLVQDYSERQFNGNALDIKKFVFLLWRYTLRVVTIQTVVKHLVREAGHTECEDLNFMRAFLDRNGYSDNDIGDILHDTFERINSSLRPGTNGVAEVYAQARALYSIKHFKKCVQLIPKLLEKRRLLIVLDTLESYEIHNQPMKLGLRGVIAAILDFYREDALKDNVDLKFFLPAEIYEDVASEIPAKTIGNTVFLRWKSKDLIALLSIRYLEMLKKTKLIDKTRAIILDRVVASAIESGLGDNGTKILRKGFWYENSFFPSHITNRLNDNEDTFAYIFRHTQKRPREIIFAVNAIIDRSVARNELPAISEASIKEGLHDNATLQLIVSEALSPFEGYISKIVDRSRATFFRKKRIMSGGVLKQFAHALYEIGPVGSMTPDDFIEFLLRSGVVGLVKDPDHNRSSGHKYTLALFEYLMQDHAALSSEFHYAVHPALGDFFSMVSPKEYGPIYPEPIEDKEFEMEIGIVTT